ncbi:hypothetical protein O6H91_05G091600 [Diphasiastrum complanatum]|uniref:Uncharacterized protein n=1 Tax=Diphasiastrum complanatum TaxID=34168 RepID=A0ACC2DQX7_DIPCM|nr:hypothetical protein O6H91_05G091600 [Diphasiastrum complanatum]
MGKPEQSAAASLEINGNSAQTGTSSCFDCDSFCSKSNFRRIVTLILSLQLLVFALLMLRSHEKHKQSGPFPLLEVPIAASFRIRKSPSFIHSHLTQLERNISEEIGFPGKVAVVSVDNLSDSNWTEVTIGVPLDGSKNASTDLQMLKATFVKFFLRERNLSLPSTMFGKVSDFQVEKFPGGITVVPEPSSLSRRGVLFNFTIHNSLSRVDSQFTEFKLQLAEGICLGPHENLITRLTNLDGSTSQPPVIVQTSVFQAVGHHLPTQRLKQLALHVTRHLSKNLGLNHTMFGRVRDVDLSPYLKHLLEPYKDSPTPAPSPGYHGHHHLRNSHHHHKGRSGTGAFAPAPHSSYPSPKGSPLSFVPHQQAPTPAPFSESPHPAYSPLVQPSLPSVSTLPPESDTSRGSPVLPPSTVPSVSLQAPQGDDASPVQPPTSSSWVSRTVSMTLMLMLMLPVAALLWL